MRLPAHAFALAAEHRIDKARMKASLDGPGSNVYAFSAESSPRELFGGKARSGGLRPIRPSCHVHLQFCFDKLHKDLALS
jgi:hypothetical protein